MSSNTRRRVSSMRTIRQVDEERRQAEQQQMARRNVNYDYAG